MTEHGSACFDGDGYSLNGTPRLRPAGCKSADHRGCTSGVESARGHRSLRQYNILTPRELHSRYEIYLGNTQL